MEKINIRPFDPANYLNDEEDIAAYLQVVKEDGDPVLLGAALGDIARTRGMSQLARDTGLSARKPLQKPVGRACAQLRHSLQGHEGTGVQADD